VYRHNRKFVLHCGVTGGTERMGVLGERCYDAR
jgi:hypothetical protein